MVVGRGHLSNWHSGENIVSLSLELVSISWVVDHEWVNLIAHHLRELLLLLIPIASDFG
jgi:hypothetical protein